MTFEQVIVLAAMLLYTAAGTSYALKGDAPWALFTWLMPLLMRGLSGPIAVGETPPNHI